MSVKYTDSVEKIRTYIENLNKTTIIISNKFCRSVECPSMCGGCCLKFSLDFFEGQRWENFKKEYPEEIQNFKYDGISYKNNQENNQTRWCQYLDMNNGRCKIHKSNPFSCEFELNKIMYKSSNDTTYIITKMFGRGWQFKRVDGNVGAICKIGNFDKNVFERNLELLKELKEISIKLNIENRLEEIINYLEKNRKMIIENKGFDSHIIFKKKQFDEIDLW